MRESDSQDDENGIAPQSGASDVRNHVRTALAQLARHRTPWRSQMPFAEPADAPGHHGPEAPKAIGGMRLSKATRCGPGIVPEA